MRKAIAPGLSSMATKGWFSSWYQDQYFPAVWFAPADESGVNPDELKPSGSGGKNWGMDRLRVRAAITDEGDSLLALATVPNDIAAALAVVDDADVVQAQAFITWQQVEMVLARARLVRSPQVALIRSRYEAAT